MPGRQPESLRQPSAFQSQDTRRSMVEIDHQVWTLRAPELSPNVGRSQRLPALEHEVLRVSALLAGDQPSVAIQIARNAILQWAQNRTTGKLPAEAWNYDSFDHLSGGRNCSAVRISSEADDIWVMRVEDPDKSVPGRIWTTELAVFLDNGVGRFTARQIVGSPELRLDVEPHVPGVVLQIIDKPGLVAGNFKRVPAKPVTIRTQTDANLLIDTLVEPSRKLPTIVLSVASDSPDEYQPSFDAKELARACAGLALVVVLPAKFSWALTYRFGKRLSVYEGAARVYLPGFTEDANPFGGHEVLLPEQTAGDGDGLKRLRWIAAQGSVRRLELGTDVLSYAQLKLRSLEIKQRQLVQRGAAEDEQLTGANQQIALLQEQLQEAEYWQSEFSRLHDLEQDRAETAEAQLRASGFRIQQLLAELKSAGAAPDTSISLPADWEDFNDWCDEQLAGRVLLTPQTRGQIRKAEFKDVPQAARCLLWLANDLRQSKLEAAGGSLADRVVEPGVRNAHCGADAFEIEWQGKTRPVEWHIKNGGNTRDPTRCLRIYYFWDDPSQQAVIAFMPAHRRTEAS
jgi:hypothetical protein